MAKKTIKLSKSTSQRYHAQGRYLQRYEHRLKKEEYLYLCNLIKDNKPEVKLLEKQTLRVSVYTIKCHLHSECIVAVYDKKRNRISTFLPIGTKKEDIVWEKYSDVEYEIWQGEENENIY